MKKTKVRLGRITFSSCAEQVVAFLWTHEYCLLTIDYSLMQFTALRRGVTVKDKMKQMGGEKHLQM